MSSGNVTLHPFNSGAAAILRACPERAERVERKTSLDISEIIGDSSTSLGMTKKHKRLYNPNTLLKFPQFFYLRCGNG